MELLKSCILFVFILVCNGQATIEIQRHFEFENALTKEQNSYRAWRSEASNLKTLRLEDQDRTHTIELSLCVDPVANTQNVTVVIFDIRYSNNGASDVIFINLQGVPHGSFSTVERWRSGNEWNVFRNSGVVGRPKVFTKGTYTLQISVQTDRWGVELDKIRVNAVNQNPAKALFCGASLTKG